MAPCHYANSIKLIGSQEAKVPHSIINNSPFNFAIFSAFFLIYMLSLSVIEAHRKPTTGTVFKTNI